MMQEALKDILIHAPKWVVAGDYEKDLNQYYTKPEIATECYRSFKRVAKQHAINLRNKVFIEPSAGLGAFLDLMPRQRRIGIDIDKQRTEVVQENFLNWRPDETKRYIALGNPPFGARGWLALAFINRAALFCDMVGFILPMFFTSDGKGSAKHRVKGLDLVYSKELPSDIFYTADNKQRSINTVWQVWVKEAKRPRAEPKSCHEYVDVYTVCTYPSRRCGLERMQKYDCFIASTFYRTTEIVYDFKQVRYGSGYGIIIKKNKDAILHLLKNTDWNLYSTQATNHCCHIGKQHICQRIIDGGFYDDCTQLRLNRIRA